jgi:hypothetical protein
MGLEISWDFNVHLLNAQQSYSIHSIVQYVWIVEIKIGPYLIQNFLSSKEYIQLLLYHYNYISLYDTSVHLGHKKWTNKKNKLYSYTCMSMHTMHGMNDAGELLDTLLAYV